MVSDLELATLAFAGLSAMFAGLAWWDARRKADQANKHADRAATAAEKALELQQTEVLQHKTRLAEEREVSLWREILQHALELDDRLTTFLALGKADEAKTNLLRERNELQNHLRTVVIDAARRAVEHFSGVTMNPPPNEFTRHNIGGLLEEYRRKAAQFIDSR